MNIQRMSVGIIVVTWMILVPYLMAQEDNPRIYYIKGLVSSPSLDGQVYERAKQAIFNRYPEIANRVNIRIFHSDGSSTTNEGTSIFQDVASHPNAKKFVVAYSLGTPTLDALVSQNVPLEVAVIVDGVGTVVDFRGKPVKKVVVIRTQDPFLHGLSHPADPEQFTIWNWNGSEWKNEMILDIPHTKALEGFANLNGFDWLFRRAVSGASAGTFGGVGSAGGGGVESRPPWLGRSGEGGGGASMFSQHTHQISQSSSEVLEKLIPLVGPRGEIGHRVIPKDVLSLSNAINSVGMDYVDSTTGRTVAAIFGAETINAVYEHDYAVCTRVQNYKVRSLLPFKYNLSWWWTIYAENPHLEYEELVIPLTIILNGSQALVDSRYLVEYYPDDVSGTVLNYQIWAADLPDALFFLNGILSAVATEYSVEYANLSDPPTPTVFARSASYRNLNINLVLENQGEAQEVRFFGPTWTEPRREAEIFVEFTFDVPEGRSEVNLPVGPIHDAVIYIEAGDFLDKVYVASGYWFSFDDSGGGGTSQVSLRTGELQHDPFLEADSTFVSPPMAEMTGSVTNVVSWAHIGIGYAFQQAREPLDLSAYNRLLFYAKGDEKQYRMKLESEAVKDNDYHGSLFVASEEWTLISIPFSEFQQEGWGEPVAWTSTDIHTISFVTVDRPLDSVYLAIDRISFVNKVPTGITSPDLERNIPKQFALSQNHPNPFNPVTTIQYDLPQELQVTLKIFNLLGQEVRTLIKQEKQLSGRHQVVFDGRDNNSNPLPSGIYIYRIVAGEFRATRKMILLK